LNLGAPHTYYPEDLIWAPQHHKLEFFQEVNNFTAVFLEPLICNFDSSIAWFTVSKAKLRRIMSTHCPSSKLCQI